MRGGVMEMRTNTAERLDWTVVATVPRPAPEPTPAPEPEPQDLAACLAGPNGLDLVVELAHDLRSPLTSILFLTEALQQGQGGTVTPEQSRQLGLVYSAALSLCATASDVLELARGGNRLVDRAPAPFSVAETFASVRSMILPIAEEKGLAVRLVHPVPERRVGQAREGHGRRAPGRNPTDLGNPVLLRGRVSLPGGLGLVTLPRVTLRRVTLPRVVARSLHTTPVRHIAPAPEAPDQAGASPEDMGSVTNVSRRARARTLPRVLGMTTLLDLQPAQPARPKLSLVHSAPLRPRDRERGGRRIFNFIVAVVGLVLTFPLMLLIAALIKLTSRGPVLFTQTRVGLDRRALSNAGGNTRRHTDQGGAPFTMYKFRTMRHANGNGKQVWAQADDVRVTPIGRVLRKLRLDELPQLFNVLTGEMNIVGPRPEQDRKSTRLN